MSRGGSPTQQAISSGVQGFMEVGFVSIHSIYLFSTTQADLEADPPMIDLYTELQDSTPSVMVVLAWFLLLRRFRNSGWQVALVSLPGTWLHEMMHLIYGFLLCAKPVSFSLWPKRVGDSWVLGSVGFTNLNIWNSAFVAFAPLTMVFVGGALFQWWLVPAYLAGSHIEWLGAGYVVACCFFSCLPSTTDVRIGAASALMYSALGYGLWLATH